MLVNMDNLVLFIVYFLIRLTIYSQAIQAALKKLDEGCSIEDAKTVCEPEILAQVFKWKVKT